MTSSSDEKLGIGIIGILISYARSSETVMVNGSKCLKLKFQNIIIVNGSQREAFQQIIQGQLRGPNWN